MGNGASGGTCGAMCRLVTSLPYGLGYGVERLAAHPIYRNGEVTSYDLTEEQSPRPPSVR